MINGGHFGNEFEKLMGFVKLYPENKNAVTRSIQTTPEMRSV